MLQCHARHHGQRLAPIVKAKTKLPPDPGNALFPLSCFCRWSGPGSPEGTAEDTLSLKIEAQCKQCGQAFVKYAYDRTSRCEACRKEQVKLPPPASLRPCRL
jgi:hypothetical protein